MTNYTDSMSYEFFIRRAFNCDRDSNGADQSYMRNLLDAEEGNRHSFLPTLEKQLNNVKKYLGKAFEKFLKKDISESERTALIALQQLAENSSSGYELLDIANRGLEITRRFIDIESAV
jgi:hypothetical protein